jgi:enoyl-CoA hydratase/carnithine racemase
LKARKDLLVPVKFHLEERIAVLTLARPKRLNAISSDMLDAFAIALDQAEASTTDVILLQAEGRAFCAGDDLAELVSTEPTIEYATDFVSRLQDISRKLMFGRKPVVCAAQGYIVGGGAAWPLNADLSILADDAVMFCPEAHWGMFPSGGVTALLPTCCGPVRANEILWRGLKVRADDLVSMGIAGQVIMKDELAGAARVLANEIADLPIISRMRMKALRIDQWRDRIETAMIVESRNCIEAATDLSMRAKVMKARS